MDDSSGTPTEIPPSAETPLMFSSLGSSTSDEPVPDELHDLICVTGVHLVRCANAWNIEGCAAKLRKHLSVTSTIEEEITGEDILDSFECVGFDVTKVASIQRGISNRSWVVSFTEQEEKYRVISKGCVKIKSTMVFVGDADSCTDIVKIFEAPDEMPDTVVIGHLSCSERAAEQCEAMRVAAEAAVKEKEKCEKEEREQKKQWEKERAEKDRQEKERVEKEREEKWLEQERAARREER